MSDGSNLNLLQEGFTDLQRITRNGGFSGVDIDIVVMLPAVYDRQGNIVSPATVYQLGSLQTVSFQSYTSKEAIRSLGFRNARGYARGSRTIAGTMMLNQLYTHVLDDAREATILEDKRGILTHSSGDIVYVRNAPIDANLTGLGLGQAGYNDAREGILSPRVVSKRHQFDFTWDQKSIGRRLQSSELPPFDIIAIFANEYGNVGKIVIHGVDIVTEGSVLSIEDIYTEVSMQFVARDIEYFHATHVADVVKWTTSHPYQDMLNDSDAINESLRVADEEQRINVARQSSSGLQGLPPRPRTVFPPSR